MRRQSLTSLLTKKNNPLTSQSNGLNESSGRAESSTSALRTYESRDASATSKEVTATTDAACTAASTNLDDLARIVTAWPNLSEPIKRAMLALIGANTVSHAFKGPAHPERKPLDLPSGSPQF